MLVYLETLPVNILLFKSYEAFTSNPFWLLKSILKDLFTSPKFCKSVEPDRYALPVKVGPIA